jgi:CheY-like chemotaxis protein
VDALQRRSFDLVLMDVHMPGMDGLEATRAIRALAGPNSRTPIIAMTASVMPEDRNSCLQAGMNDFVSKPVDLAALAEVLNRWLAASVEPGGEAGDRPELSVR